MPDLDMRASTEWIDYWGRVQTGVVQFGCDWPGVFIRGDEAMGLADMLVRLTQEAASPLLINNSKLDGLIETLRSCSVRSAA